MDGEFWETRQKDLPSLLAGQFSSVCDAMMSHADANYVLYISSSVCMYTPAPDEACLG